MYSKIHLLFLINILLFPFKLYWNSNAGLVYKYNIVYGDIGFNITKNLQEVIDFLGLGIKEPDVLTKYTLRDFLTMLSTCKYAHLPSIFTYKEYSNTLLESFHSELIKHIRYSIEAKSNSCIKINNTYQPFQDNIKLINFIDQKFNKKGNFLKGVLQLDKHVNSNNKKFIKNKFNGNIIMEWVPELKPGKYLSDIMDAFKQYVIKNEKEFFPFYIKKTPTKQIRIHFVEWYEHEIKILDRRFNSLTGLPF